MLSDAAPVELGLALAELATAVALEVAEDLIALALDMALLTALLILLCMLDMELEAAVLLELLVPLRYVCNCELTDEAEDAADAVMLDAAELADDAIELLIVSIVYKVPEDES